MCVQHSHVQWMKEKELSEIDRSNYWPPLHPGTSDFNLCNCSLTFMCVWERERKRCFRASCPLTTCQWPNYPVHSGTALPRSIEHAETFFFFFFSSLLFFPSSFASSTWTQKDTEYIFPYFHWTTATTSRFTFFFSSSCASWVKCTESRSITRVQIKWLKGNWTCKAFIPVNKEQRVRQKQINRT